MYKIHHRKEVIIYLNVYRIQFRYRQDVSDGTQTSIYFIKDYLQTALKIIYLFQK